MLTQKAEIMDEKAMGRAIARISYEIIERNKGTENLYIVGILSPPKYPKWKEKRWRLGFWISRPVGTTGLEPVQTTRKSGLRCKTQKLSLWMM